MNSKFEVPPVDFLINLINMEQSPLDPHRGEIPGQFTANRELLVKNFDYFDSFFKYNTTSCESLLDFGLTSKSVELCYILPCNGRILDLIQFIESNVTN